MLTTMDLIIMAVGGVALLMWMIFFIGGLKYANLFEALDGQDYRLKEIYFVGYEILNVIKYQYKSKHTRRLRKELSILYDEKYADYYVRVIFAQKITISFTVFVLAFPMYGLSGEFATLFIMLMFSGVAYYYYGTMTEKKILSRSEELLSDFSNVVSKLALLTNAGMIMREAWEEVAYTGSSTLYTEMQRTVDEMNNGVSEIDAFYNFGTRCIIPEIKKFTSTIVQGLIKGNSELSLMIQQQSKEVWSAKKQNARRQGEKAASKLLIPILIMFIGILIMIIVPIFANLGL